MIWWEKTVEYSYVRNIITGDEALSPLDGNAEKAFGDLIQKSNHLFKLIEFKKSKLEFKSELEKYEKHKVSRDSCKSVAAWFEKNCPDLPKMKGATAHWLVYGDLFEKQLVVRACPYHFTDTKPNEIDPRNTSGTSIENFKEYLSALNEIRGKDSVGSGSLVLASVGETTVATMTIGEFSNNFSLNLELDNNAQDEYGLETEQYRPSKPSSPW